MSKLEDDISRAMAGHDDEAPRAADLLRALEQASRPAPPRLVRTVHGRGRRRRGGGGKRMAGGLLGGHKQAPVSGGAIPVQRLLSCPASYAHQAPWVPAKPAGIDGRSRLVPQITPSSALLCAYRGSNTARQQAGWALSGQRPLAGGLASLASQLTWKPRSPHQPIACTAVGGPQTNYLIGLAYPGGARYGSPRPTSPTVRRRLQRRVTSSRHYRPRREHGVRLRPVARPHASVVQPVLPGHRPARPGHGDGSRRLDVRDHLRTQGPRGDHQLSGPGLGTQPAADPPLNPGCPGTPGPSAAYQIFFSYPEGPPVLVSILVGCHPAIDNNGLQANSASSVIPVIRQLLNPR